jgi:Eukaryotic aspartyl protease
MAFRSTLLAATALFTFAPSVTATASTPGVVGFEFTKSKVLARDFPHLARRQSNTVQAGLDNALVLYAINVSLPICANGRKLSSAPRFSKIEFLCFYTQVTVGTPPQPFALQLDTGSSDIWFPDSSAPLCQEGQCIVGAYDITASSTVDNLNVPFQISYVDGTNIEGNYITDVLNIGSTKLTNMTMASASQLRAPAVGIMGIGYQAGESISQDIAAGLGGSLYPNVINVLKDQGHINQLAYSLWLNDLDSNTGSILFGGVDTAKYHGDLTALPVQVDSQSGGLTSFTVAWTGLSFTSGGKTSDLSPSAAVPAILDSGTTNLLLPDDIANQVLNGLGIITDVNYGNVVNCDLLNDAGTFSFAFGGKGGPTVNVSLSEFGFPLTNTDGSAATFTDGTPACQFGIEAAGQAPILFGDAFLRSAYVVYDLEENSIGLAQTKFNVTDSNVKAFPSSGGIPGASTTVSAVTVTQTNTNRVLPSSIQTNPTGIFGTSRSATFVLGTATGTSGSSAGGGGGSSSSSSSAAAPGLGASAFEPSTMIAGVVALASFLFGGGLMIFL